MLADYGLDEKTVAAGLLADVLRNSEVMRSQLEEFMPTDVVCLVDRVTTMSQISEIYRTNRTGMDDEKLRQMMLAMEDVKVRVVNLSLARSPDIAGQWQAAASSPSLTHTPPCRLAPCPPR